MMVQELSKQASILIAEDSPTQAEQLRYLLEEEGYPVTVARNGREALDSARRKAPTLIVSDVLMPELDGYGFCRAVKADDHLKDTPVILLTSLSSPQDVISALECGADAFLRKPYDEKHLLSRIDQVLANLSLRGSPGVRPGIDLVHSGTNHTITAGRQQILDLLISTYAEAVRINEELSASNRQLEIRNREIEQASKFKDAFLSTMSHELRTPLHAVLGFSELLLDEHPTPLQDTQRRQISLIQAAGQHLLRLTNDLLDLSRIEAGRVDLFPEQFELDALIAEVVASLKPLADLKSQAISDRLDGSLPVLADRTRIRQVLTNLIGNAVKFTPPGGHIEVRASRPPEFVMVRILDDGPGIPPHERDRIFEPFYRLQRSVAKTEGTGLGLAITQKLVELHGGKLDVESNSGKGSCFFFTLPAS